MGFARFTIDLKKQTHSHTPVRQNKEDMAQAAPTLAPELVAKIETEAAAHYADIKANATAEQISTFWAR